MKITDKMRLDKAIADARNVRSVTQAAAFVDGLSLGRYRIDAVIRASKKRKGER